MESGTFYHADVLGTVLTDVAGELQRVINEVLAKYNLQVTLEYKIVADRVTNPLSELGRFDIIVKKASHIYEP